MPPLPFLLLPFPGEGNPAGVTIEGSIARRAETFSVRCEVRGNISMLSIPAAAETPGRKGRLWEETCVELFLGTAGSGEYREVNLSPSGDWNVYRFTGYRTGMREEEAFRSLPFAVRTGRDAVELSMEVDVGKILPAGETIVAGVAAVIRTIYGGKSHWALTHPSSRPDFHRREGFAIAIPGEKEGRPG
jgi:hypothetical protein